jgi:hypothetical protein
VVVRWSMVAVVVWGVGAVAPASALQCRTDLDCDDGVYCNGAERCMGHRRVSVGGLFVVEVRGTCQPARRGPCVRLKGLAARLCREDERDCVDLECATAGDLDGDGHPKPGCGDDCDDGDPNRFPGNAEVCDAAGHDEDCDPTTFGALDADEDGFVDAACCNGAGDARRCGRDCNDANSGVHPGLAEVCNGVDDDCDGSVDEGFARTLYADADRDGFGAAASSPVAADPCFPAAGVSVLANDCDDTNPAIHPGEMMCGAQGLVLICGSDGVFSFANCGQGTCVPQPNGTGVCLP